MLLASSSAARAAARSPAASERWASAIRSPDLKPSAADANTRALAEICLVLFNSNEFAYVY